MEYISNQPKFLPHSIFHVLVLNLFCFYSLAYNFVLFGVEVGWIGVIYSTRAIFEYLERGQLMNGTIWQVLGESSRVILWLNYYSTSTSELWYSPRGRTSSRHSDSPKFACITKRLTPSLLFAWPHLWRFSNNFSISRSCVELLCPRRQVQRGVLVVQLQRENRWRQHLRNGATFTKSSSGWVCRFQWGLKSIPGGWG